MKNIVSDDYDIDLQCSLTNSNKYMLIEIYVLLFYIYIFIKYDDSLILELYVKWKCITKLLNNNYIFKDFETRFPICTNVLKISKLPGSKL